MKHLFKATRLGWERQQEAVWFDSSKYSREEAISQFKKEQVCSKRGYQYTRFEYDGQKYYDVTYLGEFDDDKLPRNDDELGNRKLSERRRLKK